MESAQDAYRRFRRDHLAPAFREMGLRGSGSTYLLPNDSHWIGVGLQASRWSDSKQVLFTLNMSLVPKAEWEELKASWLGELAQRPSPNTTYPAGATWRIGTVLEGGDTWWAVRAGEPLDDLTLEIAWVVREGALPWLRRHIEQPDYNKTAAKRELPSLRVKSGRFLTDY